MLLGYLVGFDVWLVMRIADSLLGRAALGTARLGLIAVALAGSAYSSIQLIHLIRWGRRVRRDPELATSLNDERIQLARLRSFRVGFFAVSAAQLIPLTVTIPAVVGGQLSVLVGVTASIGSYLAFERE